jgi:hypothetical protein
MPPKERAPKPASGMEFPWQGDDKKRSTMSINKQAFVKAMGAVNKEKSEAIDALPDKKWRFAYQKNVVDNVRESAKKPENALAVAQAGLDYLHETMVFIRPAKDNRDTKPEGPELSLKEAMAKYTNAEYKTYEIKGSAPCCSDYTVQYKSFGKEGPLQDLKGNDLRRQIDTWVKTGAIEKDCGVAMTRVVDNPEWCDLSDLYFVLFGASSAMGPFYKLMDHGANVIAIDLDRPQIWEKLIKDTRCRAGKLIFPVKEAIPEGATDAEIAKLAGCNLTEKTPEIRTWLQDLYPKERFLCMALAYLDGEMFVKLSMAMDAIIASLVEKRGADKMGVGYLCTPTDAHLCTASSVADAKSRYAKSPPWHKLLEKVMSFTKMPMRKNVVKDVIVDDSGNEIDGLQVVDCIVPQQGPNYILAKRLQHWRAMICREKGVIASSNIAPSTATASVLSNVMFALSYNGFPNMKPMEITYQETSNCVMAALLIRDLRDPSAAANPKTKLPNPLCLFGESAWHGGCWRTGYKFDSLGTPAVASYLGTAVLVDPYLFFYNLLQALGWLRVLLDALSGGASGSASLWAQAYTNLTFIQHLGMMEVVHAAAGLTKSDAFTTFIQIFSRVLIIAVVDVNRKDFKDDQFIIPMMLLAWSMADFTRYVFYAVGLLRTIATNLRAMACAMKLIKGVSPVRVADPVFQMPFVLMWLRYSLFIVLYPTGVSGELLCIWKTFSAVTSTKLISLDNGGFSPWLFQCMQLLVNGSGRTWGTMVGVSYGVGLPMLMMMLLASRSKVITGCCKRKKTSPPKKASSEKKNK